MGGETVVMKYNSGGQEQGTEKQCGYPGTVTLDKSLNLFGLRMLIYKMEAS